ncbi:hypothetical protein ANN_09985 [Periplaneta americana]|uniref:Uncharacterized protein n=1 Tax=Periplaneta americana TaxID=6978 RepID=A0ABQ8TRH7_PERAM|nr:hypothetical protein ANN_09985 [Periplaneta americana]
MITPTEEFVSPQSQKRLTTNVSFQRRDAQQRTTIPSVFFNVRHVTNEAVLERVSEERMMLKLIRKRKRDWLSHWLRRNCLLKDALEGMVNGRRVRGRRRYQMIEDIKNARNKIAQIDFGMHSARNRKEGKTKENLDGRYKKWNEGERLGRTGLGGKRRMEEEDKNLKT